jgi:hypothetical protein
MVNRTDDIVIGFILKALECSGQGTKDHLCKVSSGLKIQVGNDRTDVMGPVIPAAAMSKEETQSTVISPAVAKRKMLDNGNPLLLLLFGWSIFCPEFSGSRVSSMFDPLFLTPSNNESGSSGILSS